MKSSKQILENLVDTLIDAEPLLKDSIRPLLARANRELGKIEEMAAELNED